MRGWVFWFGMLAFAGRASILAQGGDWPGFARNALWVFIVGIAYLGTEIEHS